MRTANPDAPAKQQLLDAAQRLMLQKGFSATTVDQVCEEAGLTKGSFFHYFKSKEALGKELLERFCIQTAALHKTFSGNARDPLKRVYNYLDGVAKLAKDPMMQQGCLLGTLSQELSDTYPDIRCVCESGFRSWAESLAQELGAAKAAYAPRKAIDPLGLAEYFIAVLEGALILGKAQKDVAVVEDSLRHFKKYVQLLFEEA